MKKIIALAIFMAASAYSLAQAPNWRALRFSQSDAFYSYLMEDMHRCYWQRQQELQRAMKSKTALQQYITDAQKRMQQVVGELPERTPLQPQVTGTIPMEGFHVEKIVFQSTPGRYVTAHLYMPDHAKTPVPACIDMCGHGITGKGRGAALPVRMAMNGIAVMVVDPIAQGERLQLIDKEGNDLFRTAGQQSGRSGVFRQQPRHRLSGFAPRHRCRPHRLLRLFGRRHSGCLSHSPRPPRESLVRGPVLLVQGAHH